MGVNVDLIGWVGVGLGGTYGCRCGILHAPMLGVVFLLCFLTEFTSPHILYSIHYMTIESNMNIFRVLHCTVGITGIKNGLL